MNRHPFAIAAICVFAGLAVMAGVAAAATSTATVKAFPFTAKYAGTAVVKVDETVANISANGAGKGTLLGVGKVTGKGTGNTAEQPCIPFTGVGTMTGTLKTKLVFKVVPSSSGCGDEAGQVFSINARATVVKGYGKLVNAHGKLKITGTYDRGKGTFAVKFAGTLTK